MSSVTEPVVKQSRLNGNLRSAKDWLDALSSGACDQSQFFHGVGDLVRKAPDAGWELLGLADQYYRRGKISAQTFGSLKTHLQGLLVGTGTSDEVSAPPPRMQDEPRLHAAPAPRAAPASSAASAASAPSSPSRVAPATIDSTVAIGAAHGVAPAPDSNQRPLAAGDMLRGRYLVQGLLGQGGMGTVYDMVDR